MLSIIHHADESTLAKIMEEMAVRKTREFFILFGFGSQTDGLIFLMLSKIGVFCLLADPETMTAKDVIILKGIGLIGMIGSGGPYSVYSKDEPVPFDFKIFGTGIPFLGICLSCQMIAKYAGAEVVPATISECNPEGTVRITDNLSPLFDGIPSNFFAGFSHGDRVMPAATLHVTAINGNGIIAAVEAGNLHGVQFHPEVSHTTCGQRLFGNFCSVICMARDRFPVTSVAEKKIAALRDLVGDDVVLIALSGGVDSSVSLELLCRAKEGKGGHIHALYISGLDRYLDEQDVRGYVPNKPWLTVHFVDAAKEFLDALEGIEDGAEKRLAMKGVYVSVIERMIKEVQAKWLVSGTNYADISESGLSLADIAPNTIQLNPRQAETAGIWKAKIKGHHNLGNTHSVPEVLPVVDLVKDLIRDLGRELCMPEELLMKQPFPGPGLSIRIDGEFTAPKYRIERELDRIWDEELKRAGHASQIWQYGVDLLRSNVTTSRGDGNGTGYRAVLWAKTSVNGFTAEPYLGFDLDFLRKVAVRMTSEVPEVGCVEYDVTPKPPKTIEQT